MPALTDKKKEDACQAYVLSGSNKTQAFRDAYPQSKRWKDKTVTEKACRLFKEPAVAARVEELEAEAAKIAQEQFGVDAAWMLKRLYDEATADMADLIDDSGAVKPISEWPKIWRTGLVSGLDVDVLNVDGQQVGQAVKLKLSERVKRLELLGRHVDVQAFKDKMDVSATISLADFAEDLPDPE